MKTEAAKAILKAAYLSAVKVFDEGKWYVFAMSLVVIGWVLRIDNGPAVILFCAFGYGKLMWERWSSYNEWVAHQKVHKMIPVGIFQMDETHWSVETQGGETIIVEMPSEYDMRRDGPFPLLQEYAPDLMDCMGAAAEGTQMLKIQLQHKEEE